MPFDLGERAVTHELNRQKAVAKILVDLYCIAVLGLIDVTRPIVVSGAASQSLSGSRSRDTQAAHCIPRQLFIGTQKLQDAFRSKFPERAFAIEALFGETDILPSNFNKSDSRAEGCGLAEAFRFASETVIFDARFSGKLQANDLDKAVRGAFAQYRERAAKAFKESTRQLEQKVREIERSRIQHTIRSKEEMKWREQLEITKAYAQTLGDGDGLEKALKPGVIWGILRIYSMVGMP